MRSFDAAVGALPVQPNDPNQDHPKRFREFLKALGFELSAIPLGFCDSDPDKGAIIGVFEGFFVAFQKLLTNHCWSVATIKEVEVVAINVTNCIVGKNARTPCSHDQFLGWEDVTGA